MTESTADIGGFAPPAAVYRLRITQVTSLVFVSRRGLRSQSGSREEVEAFYRKVWWHNLLLGWWGFPAGPIWTLMSLFSNHKALVELRSMTPEAPAAWLSDPSGHHVARYWDGQRWTDQVTDVTTDPVTS